MGEVEAGPVLGEEARSLVVERLFGEAPEWCAVAAVDALEEHVAALVAAAEQRGAAKERERIGKRVRATIGSSPSGTMYRLEVLADELDPEGAVS